MANPWEFLDRWANENVHATVHDDKSTAERLVHECLRAAKRAGVTESSLIKAGGDDLESFDAGSAQ